jgi:DNA-directed RNA polymerase subunit M/transcription elongation factor TFIIS
LKKNYYIIACPKCQQFLLARQGVKTRNCPYCGARMNLAKVEVLWMTSDLKEARSVLRSKREGRSVQPTGGDRLRRISTRF